MTCEFETRVQAGGVIHFEVPELPEGQSVRVPIAVERLAPHGILGWARGGLWISPDFDEPLEEFKDYML